MSRPKRDTLPRNAEIFVLGAALPELPETKLRAFCHAREAALAPWLAEEQRAHIRHFALSGAALAARASRLLARVLLLRGLALATEGTRSFLPEQSRLEADASGRPLLPGWSVGFSHSGKAAFCALRRNALITEPGPAALSVDRPLGLDAEALDSLPPPERAFAPEEKRSMLSPTAGAREALRRWTIKEALLKAAGTGLNRDPALIATGCCGQRAGALELDGRRLLWRLLPCPGHWLCLATPATGIPAEIRFLWSPDLRAFS